MVSRSCLVLFGASHAFFKQIAAHLLLETFVMRLGLAEFCIHKNNEDC